MKNKKRYGVKIKNPLKLPVRVHVKSATGAIRSGAMNGKETSREIGPGGEIFVSTKGSCELDIDVTIFRYEETGMPQVLGKGDVEHVGHRDSTGKQLKTMPTRVTEDKKPEPEKEEPVIIRSLGDMLEDHAKKEVAV